MKRVIVAGCVALLFVSIAGAIERALVGVRWVSLRPTNTVFALLMFEEIR